MKVLNNFEHSVNFVDENNNFIGYEMHRDCCEYYGYVISDTQDIGQNSPRTSYPYADDGDHNDGGLDDYCIDPSYYERKTVDIFTPKELTKEWNLSTAIDVHQFRLIGDGLSDKYLNLYNDNGYYIHICTTIINGVKKVLKIPS